MNNSFEIYGDIELDSDVMTASNHRLIQLLFEKCMKQIQQAKIHIINKNIKQKHATIQKANDIVIYLREILNVEDESTKKIAGLLDSVYESVGKALLYATLNNDIDYLDHAYKLLTTIKEGWDGMV